MKKAFSFALAFLLLFSVAYADDLLLDYNLWAKRYGATVFDESMLFESTELLNSYISESKTLSFAKINSTEFNTVIVMGEDDEGFLPCCVSAAMSLNPSIDDITTSLGFLLYGYLFLKGGEESYLAPFGENLVFEIKKVDTELRFSVGKM